MNKDLNPHPSIEIYLQTLTLIVAVLSLLASILHPPAPPVVVAVNCRESAPIIVQV